jgi:hypothetical protein
MNFDGIMLVIATDNAREGLRFALNVYLDQCPKWCLVTEDPKVIRAIPDGMPCIGKWMSRHPSLAELAWRERQASGKSSGVSEKMMDRIADWQRRHEERERAIAFAHLTPDAAAKVAEEPAAPDMPAAAVIEAQAAVKAPKSGGSKWR